MEERNTVTALDGEPILAVFNAHCAQCGSPPNVVVGADNSVYVGFFTNRYGEQLLIDIDCEAGHGTVRGGDFGWDTVIKI